MAVVFFGRLGAGKTTLLNKLTGGAFTTSGGVQSCTRIVQCGYTSRNNLTIVDSPGLEAKQEPIKHLAQQKLALEHFPLGAIAVVVKGDRADVVAHAVEPVLDFLGDKNEDMVRVIVTHAEIERAKSGYDEEELKASIADSLSLKSSNQVYVIGFKDDVAPLEDWLGSTRVSPERLLEIPEKQLACIAALSKAHRSFSRPIASVEFMIDAALNGLHKEVDSRDESTDDIIVAVQASVKDEVLRRKEEIFRSVEDQTEETRHLVYGQAGVALSIKMKKFMEMSNKLMSWDVSNPAEPRNMYRCCHNCGAVYMKTEGCDDGTICGAVPSAVQESRSPIRVEFVGFHSAVQMELFFNGVKATGNELRNLVHTFRHGRQVSKRGGGTNRLSRGTIESGCGAAISWRSMAQISADQMKEVVRWGEVEVVQEEGLEVDVHRDWSQKLNAAYNEGKQKLSGGYRTVAVH